MGGIQWSAAALLVLLVGLVGATVTFEEAFPNLPTWSRPTDILNAPGESASRVFVVEQSGIVYVFQNSQDVSSRSVFIDLRSIVHFPGSSEMGLLGMTFHPNYASNGRLFLYFNTDASTTELAEFLVSNDDADAADLSSRSTLLTIAQPATNHNGGQLAFGPDGYLYVALGDGGGSGDPNNVSQDVSNILGTILRLDIDSASPYAIPPTNPFASGGGVAEIYAWGLRNPWRFSFDSATGMMWIADVGQNAKEEISVINTPENMGWREWEGCDCFDAPCNAADGTVMPVHQYAHLGGGRSVTGGFVYRDTAITDIVGRYVFGDFMTGEIFSLPTNVMGDCGTSAVLEVDTDLRITTFGYIGDQLLFGALGGVYRITDPNAPPSNTPTPTRTASGTGTAAVTPSTTTSLTASRTPSATRSVSSTTTRTVSATPSVTSSPSESSSVGAPPSTTASAAPSQSPTASRSPSSSPENDSSDTSNSPDTTDSSTSGSSFTSDRDSSSSSSSGSSSSSSDSASDSNSAAGSLAFSGVTFLLCLLAL